MQLKDREVLIPMLLSIARESGRVINEIYQAGDVAAWQKADLSLVSEADLAAHHVLKRHLETLLPNCSVVSEEDKSTHAYRRSDGRFWLIDPLDGTKEFIARNGEFTVNIALIDEGRSELGVVYAPAIDTLYWGGMGVGAFRTTGEKTVAITVGKCNADGICRVVASKSHLNDETRTFIGRLGPVNLVQAGSSLKICCVADGSADIYPRLAPTCEWDTAAAQAVLEGAGGAILSLQGEPLRYGKADVLNPSFIATRDAALIPA